MIYNYYEYYYLHEERKGKQIPPTLLRVNLRTVFVLKSIFLNHFKNIYENSENRILIAAS